MWRKRGLSARLTVVVLCTIFCGGIDSPAAATAAESLDSLLTAGRQALGMRSWDTALAAANEAVKRFGGDFRPRVLRADIYEAKRDAKLALADCDALLSPPLRETLPEPAAVYDLRGRIKFYLGDVKGSAGDFDRAVELEPERAASHWQRGISYYYAERYEDGRRQFEGYQTVDSADVENGVWRSLCMTRNSDFALARRSLLKIGDDRRVPMRQIYEMFAGRSTPDQVLVAAEEGLNVSPDERRSRRFYAHLYVGLYWEAAGEPEKSLEHVREAAQEFPIRHYMADVARTHLLLRSPAPVKP